MNHKEIQADAFFLALQGICALHRPPFFLDLAQQQLAAPHTVASSTHAAGVYGFDATLRNKSCYREGQMEVRAPQDGVFKGLATTPVGAVVQPDSVVTLVLEGEQLFADINIKNEDVGLVRVGQSAQIKLSAYPFQRFGMLKGEVVHVSADASMPSRQGGAKAHEGASMPAMASYKARTRLDQQSLKGPRGSVLRITAGAQIMAEINQAQRTVPEYLLSPVQEAVSVSARER
ncbi:HlyD family efflux transporter periplasmic adaptor subunit [Massilia antarctica]|uniref:HlyD family efflux transporter periplasmic adaptor subunit n=1 Tax=Massilia antarctica TaxID=2765360 RepID=UPI0006BB8441|nr:HlyD family efflux transporter periplasmic adaptor subunit [Massilia sp. H27-R4]